MQSFLNTKNKIDCNGCGICELLCPKKAITMKEDKEGFLYPFIDKNKCNNCGICKKKCSNIINNKGNNIINYVCFNKDINKQKKATSGGVFELLSNEIINNRGVVFGVAFDKKFNVKHISINKINDINKLNGSKYVRSDLNNSFNKILKELNDNNYVLFSGTPCQCYALRKFLNKDYEKLLICDIYCHSNPSPKIYKKYIEEIENKKNKKIKNIYFRGNKSLNIKYPYIEFEDGSKSNIKLYRKCFIDMAISRSSCSSCSFRNIKRFSDITLGDYWDKNINIDNEFGLSLVSVNTKKGLEYFNKIKKELIYEEVDLSNYKFNRNRKLHSKRNFIFKNIDKNYIIKYMKKVDNNILIKLYYKLFRKKN